jgi:N utilization substance protein A
MSESEALEKDENEIQQIIEFFVNKLSVGEDVATLLAQDGFRSIEEIAYVPLNELQRIEGFDENLITALRDRAQDQLLIEAITTEENLDIHGPAEDLLSLSQMTPELAYALARNGVNTKNKLAEQSIDDLQEIDGLNEDLAAKIILEAREDWFQSGIISADNKGSDHEEEIKES